MSSPDPTTHWRRTRTAAFLALCLWAVFAVALPLSAPALGSLNILGVRLGGLLTAQGSVVAFLLVAVWFVSRQNQIDEEDGEG